LNKERGWRGRGGTSGRQGITVRGGVGVEGGGGHGGARWGFCQCKRALVCASPVSTRSLVQRTSNCATTHVISDIYKRTPRLIMISNTSSASLQSRGSAQSSIPYTRYCYSPPPSHSANATSAKITQSSVILNCSNGIGLKLLMSIDRNLNPSSQCGGTSLCIRSGRTESSAITHPVSPIYHSTSAGAQTFPCEIE
jgi:hypothetical protein